MSVSISAYSIQASILTSLSFSAGKAGTCVLTLSRHVVDTDERTEDGTKHGESIDHSLTAG